MQKYLARVSLNYDTAQERMNQLGEFWNDLLAAIPKKNDAEKVILRFTFASFFMKAKNKADCEQVLRTAWAKAFPDNDGISEIHITENNEDDTAQLMRAIYNSYYGVDEYQRLTTSLVESIKYLSEQKAKSVLVKQNVLFSIDSGCGMTTLLASFGDFCQRMHIYEEAPEENSSYRSQYLEIKVGKESKNGYMTPDDAVDEVKTATKDLTYSVIGFDISSFLDGHQQEDLRMFLTRLNKYQDTFIFAFRIPFLEKKSFDEIYAVLSDIMLIHSVRIPPLHDCVLMESIWNIINDTNIVPATSIIEPIFEKIHREKMDARFYGFRSAEKIANEVLLKKAEDVAKHDNAGTETDHSTVAGQDLSTLNVATSTKATGYAALKELVGMEDITAKIQEVVAQIRVSITNEKLDRPCIHMRFTGAPGTGKTTVARILGQIMQQEGILRRGGFFEYSGRDLVAEYVGQTAVKTATICRDAYGSVLFIDEAYSLYSSEHSTNDYGREALTTLVSEMENHRDDMLVIMAGYTDEMDELMKGNPGLRSRMPYKIHFPSYTKEQLFKIYMQMVSKHFDYEPDLETEAHTYFETLSDEYIASKEFANARFVRNLYERTWSKAALRASLAGKREISLIKEDFIAASGEREFSEKLDMKKTLGFHK
ncbi:MAG: AAA family ATPase [Dehalococcoidales bacterium]|nr:AAA family ATPase [Dehalococcoidales bacterium]